MEEFIAATGYHEKSAIRVLNHQLAPKIRRAHQRRPLYDEAARGALIVLWEASDRVCGKRLKALPILLPALERHGSSDLEEEIRGKLLSMSAATIDRLLQMPRRTSREKKQASCQHHEVASKCGDSPTGMNRFPALCGNANRGSFVYSLVLTDIAAGWTEAAPIVVREDSLVFETLERMLAVSPYGAGRGQRQ